jgi:hypothetical protein
MALSIILNTFESLPPLPLESRGPGTYGEVNQIIGNSILSSVFVKSISAGATLKVNYYDTSAGTTDDGERFDLVGHDLIDDTITTPYTNRITVTRIHNKPILEAIVTGGTVEFGVYFTVVSSFATDMDNALVREGDTFVQDTTRGIPMACYDETAGTLHFLRCEGGALSVSETTGDKKDFIFDGDSTPGTTQTLINTALSGTLRTFIRAVRVSCRNHGAWELLNDSTLLASGLTGPIEPNDDFGFDIPKELAVSENLTLKFRAHTPAPVSSLRAFVQATEKV